MNRIAMLAIPLCGALAFPATAQRPAAGVRFQLQLISADTSGATVDRDSRVLAWKPPSRAYVWCVRSDSGDRKRESSKCGPRLQGQAMKLLAQKTAITDAQGHVSERLSWAGGDAVVELDASDRTVAGTTEHMRVKIGFWPRLATGAAARPDSPLRITNTAASFGQSLAMSVHYKDGAQILVVVPER
jgi:hypothetical protein